MNNYTYEVFEDVTARDLARKLGPILAGKTAVCTSFDSAKPTEQEEYADLACGLTPPLISGEVIENWPLSHEDIYDEWWIFDGEVPAGFSVNPFWNYNWGTGLRHCEELTASLEKFRPFAVFGSKAGPGYIIRRMT